MNRIQHKAQGGFTLLELVVALSIFTLVGMGAFGMVHAVIQAREASDRQSQLLSTLQRSLWVMARDLEQMLPEPAAAIDDNSYAIVFRRRGWRNPMGSARSELLEVAYGLRNHQLIRYYRGSAEMPLQTQLLLDDVEEFTVNLLPPLAAKPAVTGLRDITKAETNPATRHAAEIIVTLQPFGTIRRMIELPES